MFAISLTVLLLLIIAFLLWHMYLRLAIRHEITLVRKAGHPTTLAELQAWYKEPEEGKNGAPLLIDAYHELFETPERFRHLQPEDLKALRTAKYYADIEAEALLFAEDSDESTAKTPANREFRALLERLFPEESQWEPVPNAEAVDSPKVREEQKYVTHAAEMAAEACRKANEAIEREEEPSDHWEEMTRWHKVIMDAHYVIDERLYGHDPMFIRNRNLEDDLSRLNKKPDILDSFFQPGGPAPDEDTMRVLREYFETHTNVIDRLHNIAAMDEWRFPRDFTKWPDGYHVDQHPLWVSMHILHWEAIYYTELGDVEKAVSALEAAFNLTRSAAEPVVISALVRGALMPGPVQPLAYILKKLSLSEEQLGRLEHAVARANMPDADARALIGERCLLEAATGQVWVAENIIEMSKLQELSPWFQRVGVARSFIVFHRLSDLARASRIYGLRMFRYLIDALECANESTKACRLKAIAEAYQNIPWYVETSAQLYHGLLGATRVGPPTRARLLTSRVALAVERYRLVHGRIPSTLEELGLDSPPIDPCSGEPLRYKALDDGYTVYSVGPNRRDDGGPKYETEYPRESDDVGFHIRTDGRLN